MESSSSSSTLKIPDDQLEEYQKVFSIICGSRTIDNENISAIQYLNESGYFTCNNVTAFLQKMTNNFMLTKDNVSPVMSLFDVNETMISWSNFVSAIESWVNHSSSFEGLSRRKVALAMGLQERQILHYTIANFFLLASKGVSNTVPKLNALLEQSGAKFDFHLIELFQDAKEDKAISFRDSNYLLGNFDMIAQEITSTTVKYEDIKNLNNAFRFISKAQCPIELHMSSQLLVRLFELIFNAGIFEEVIFVIAKEDNAFYHWEALKAFSYMMVCFRIKNQIFDGGQLFQSEQVKKFLLPEFIDQFVKLSFSSCIEVKEQSLICLGLLVQASEEIKNYLVSIGIIPNLSACIKEENTDRYIEAIGLLLVYIANSLSFNFPLSVDTNLLYGLIEAGYKLLNLRDIVGILRAGFEILAIALPMVNLTLENKIILERIIKLLELHNNVFVKKFALWTIKEIAEHNESQIKALIDLKLLQIIFEILNSNEHPMKLICCKILHILAKKGYVLQLFDSKALPVISKKIYDAPHCRWECIKILKAITTQSQAFTSFLVENGVVRLIFSNLGGFREQDDILLEAYGFNGLYYNIPYLIDCINILNTILINGNISKTGSNLNVYAEYFDHENIDRLQIVLENLFEDKIDLKSQLSRSYLKNYTETSFDQLLIKFLANIRNAHKSKDTEMSKAIVSQVTSLIFVVGSNLQELNNTGKTGTGNDLLADSYLEVKCFSAENFPNGDNRIITIPRFITFEQFRSAIQMKYGYFGPILIKCFDKAREALTIDNDIVLQQVLSETLESILNAGPSAEKIQLRVIVQFVETNYGLEQPKEMQCFECGKKFEVLAFFGPSDPDELFVCYNCKLEQEQMNNSIPFNMDPRFSKSPYPYSFK